MAHNVKEFVDRYNFDKDLLKNILQERRQNIDSLIDRLTSRKISEVSIGNKVVEGPLHARPFS